MKKVAINGLGRIGRIVLRHYLSNPPENVELVAANELTPMDDLAYLIRYDSVHGKAVYPMELGSDHFVFGSKKLPIFSEKDPAKLPWEELGVDIVLECTGLFRRREDALQRSR